MSVQETTEIRELTAEETEAATGALNFAFLPLLAFKQADGQEGQNDPAQMFQQIMQQMTQG